MTNVLELYNCAEENGVEVDWLSLEFNGSLSLLMPDGSCCIALDPWKMPTLADESVKLAHELGHCMTGSFYSPFTRYDLIERHENRADRWAIKKLIPKDELDAAVRNGYTEIWALAELFGVTEPFMSKAVNFYQNGNC